MQKITLGIAGMSCSACSNAIEHYLAKKDGIKSVSVNLVMANATIEYDEKVLDLKQVEQFIKESGYKSTGPFKLVDSKADLKKRKIELIVFSVLAAILLYVSMGSMLGLKVFGLKEKPLIFSIVLLVLTIPFLAYGFDIFVRGIKALFKLRPNMDSLVTIGVFASLGYSIYSFVMIALGHAHFVHELYFEAAAIVIYFIKLGKFLESQSKNKTKSAITDLVQITPEKACLLKDGQEVEVSIDNVKKGDILVCRAGQKIAVDGVIVSGSAHFNVSFITGESTPTKKLEGSSVVAGALCYDGYVQYEAQNIGKDSTISKIVNLVVEATNTKMKISKTVDVVSSIFVPVVMSIALYTLIIYLILGYSFGSSLITFVTILVVACPCSLGLGTPVAIVVSEGLCAKNGILVKKSETLEICKKINAVVFDKTGTLTHGKLKIEKIKTENDEAMILAASLEALSSHPISNAFKDYVKENNISLYEVKNFKEIAGFGISGQILKDKILVGSAKLMEKNNIKVDDSGIVSTVVFVAKNGKLVGKIFISDTVRDEAQLVIEKLKKMQIKTIMLTGDNDLIAKKIGKQLGIDEVYSQVLPTEKAEYIKKFKAEGYKVAMVGDGINDSPALAMADVGISISSATDVAINSADVVLMGDNLIRLLDFLKIGKRTLRNIKQNLFWAFIYNVLMLPIAAGVIRGLTITPMIASIAMTLSSIAVVLNALRLNLLKMEEKDG